MGSTKQKIRDAALKLFNERGMVNVRLQHIADEAFVSVGNLAYHYHNKEAILLALYEELTKRQQELLTQYRVVPLFDNIDRLIRHSFQLQQRYLYFYLDTLEIIRSYPTIGQAHQQHIDSQVGQLKSILDFNASRGALIAPRQEDQFEKLAQQIWMTMDLWWTQQAIRQSPKQEEQDYRATVWHLLIPYFTNMGQREYDQMLQMPYDFFF
ncbi:MAG: TetR/AcrR family transcriptional regulator [Bacteroidota bacterium]